MTITRTSDQPRKARKTSKCRICRRRFNPWRELQPTCGEPDCEHAYAMQVVAKRQAKQKADERKEIKARKEKIKTRREWIQDTQKEFNAFIRYRDMLAGHPCISSGRQLDWSGNAVDCGHYRSVGSAPQHRFNEDNAHAQSKMDNRFLSGAAVDYRIGLIARIGLARVEALEADNEPKKYTIPELRELRDHYRAKLRELKLKHSD